MNKFRLVVGLSVGNWKVNFDFENTIWKQPKLIIRFFTINI